MSTIKTLRTQIKAHIAHIAKATHIHALQVSANIKIIVPILLLIFGSGCQKALDVYESKSPTVEVSKDSNGAYLFGSRKISPDVVFVTGVVQNISLSLPNSPSIAGDKATAYLLVPAHTIPAHSDLTSVRLHYDNHAWLSDLKPGQEVVIRFLKNGEFDGVQIHSLFGVKPYPVPALAPTNSH